MKEDIKVDNVTHKLDWTEISIDVVGTQMKFNLPSIVGIPKKKKDKINNKMMVRARDQQYDEAPAKRPKVQKVTAEKTLTAFDQA